MGAVITDPEERAELSHELLERFWEEYGELVTSIAKEAQEKTGSRTFTSNVIERMQEKSTVYGAIESWE